MNPVCADYAERLSEVRVTMKYALGRRSRNRHTPRAHHHHPMQPDRRA